MTTFDSYRDAHNIHAMYRYHPKYFRRSPNPKHYRSCESELILRLKDLDRNAIRQMSERLAMRISQSDQNYGVEVICSFPSSNHRTHFNGIRLAAMEVAKFLDYVDGTGCLVRFEDKPKAHFGRRSLENNLATLTIEQPEYIRGKRVLLVDDITTSGHSLVAGEQKLLEAGASDVVKLALGETIYYG